MSESIRIRQELRIPLRPHGHATLYVPRPMTEPDWDQFMAVLAAMKPGLVPSLAEKIRHEEQAG